MSRKHEEELLEAFGAKDMNDLSWAWGSTLYDHPSDALERVVEWNFRDVDPEEDEWLGGPREEAELMVEDLADIDRDELSDRAFEVLVEYVEPHCTET
ncbi:MAG: hypothetical protein ABEN55_03805 [Bradymonadaceae bacterium]